MAAPRNPLWSILVPTLASRDLKFKQLMRVLLPQAESAGCVEVVALHNNGELFVGEYRQALLEAARGKYLSFIDDDDRVPHDYVQHIINALASSPDCVGFNHEYYKDGIFRGLTYCSLRFETQTGSWPHYRDFTHVQPVRTEVARLGDFRYVFPEDAAWWNQVRPHLHRDEYINKVLYTYYHSTIDTVQDLLQPHSYTPRPTISSDVFRWIESPMTERGTYDDI